MGPWFQQKLVSFTILGESGGTRVIQKIFSYKRQLSPDAALGDVDADDVKVDSDDGDESTSFYVSDDEKSIAIVDLLLESKDKT